VEDRLLRSHFPRWPRLLSLYNGGERGGSGLLLLLYDFLKGIAKVMGQQIVHGYWTVNHNWPILRKWLLCSRKTLLFYNTKRLFLAHGDECYLHSLESYALKDAKKVEWQRSLNLGLMAWKMNGIGILTLNADAMIKMQNVSGRTSLMEVLLGKELRLWSHE
jgi:hypothetical protein